MWNSTRQGSSGKQAVSVVASAHSLEDPNGVNSLQSAIGSLSWRIDSLCECRVADELAALPCVAYPPNIKSLGLNGCQKIVDQV